MGRGTDYNFTNRESTYDRMMINVRATKINWLVLGRFAFRGGVLPLAILRYPFLRFCIALPSARCSSSIVTGLVT